MATVSLRGLVKRFGSHEVVHGIDVEIADGEFLVLVGPSGCGKSTILRMIAGLEEITAGEVAIDGVVVNEKEPKNRDIAMVFQDYALYPHLSVYENMSFSLEMAKRPKAEIRQRVSEAARILNIEDLLERRPRALSGGQRQRVAMGRAIVRNPKVFLFDEPLSNLDAKLRVQMRSEIKRLHRRLGTTIVYVTHDQVEAMTMADRIVILRDGRIEQVGAPLEVYDRPATQFVAAFIGAPSINLIKCRLEESADRLELRLADGLAVSVPEALRGRIARAAGRDVVLGLRPEHVTIDDADAGPDRARFSGTVDTVEPLGADTLVFLQAAGGELVGRIPPTEHVRVGDRLSMVADLSRLHLFDAASGRSLTAEG